MGAEGVNMGTRFMATKEAPIKDGIKQALVKAKVTDSTHVMRSVKNTERVYKNEQAKKVQEVEAEFPGEFDKLYPLVKGDLYRQAFQETGDPDHSVWSCGSGLGLIDDVPSCKDLVEGIVAEAEDIIRNRLMSKL